MAASWFWIAFVATVIALAAALVTGRAGRRRAHFICVAVFVVLLFVTIRMTRVIVEAVNFPPDELALHLKFAVSATVLLAPVILTGLIFAKRGGRRWRLLHRIAVIVFVLAVLAATGTGIWIFSIAE